ncbi:MAG: hypothetical protein ACXWID_11460 [Pyrinomonadaceae bacterium]
MADPANYPDVVQTSSDQKLSRASAIAGLLALFLFIATFGVTLPQWVAWPRGISSVVFLAAVVAYFYSERRPIRRLIWRLNATFAGASKWDVAFDLIRIAGFLLIFGLTYTEHGFNFTGSLGGKLFFIAVAMILIHPIYRFFRSAGLWDKEYKLRKSMLATAINYASAALEETDYSNFINRIEINALLAVKSYLEYSVTDRDKDNFNANLIVKDPVKPDTLVCIQRSNLGEPVPKTYPVGEMQNAMKAFETGRPLYIPKFKSKHRPRTEYKMVWLVPIKDRDETTVIGLLAMDSAKPGHLDLEDGRQSLNFNLIPYISLLRYTLTLRRLHAVWP